MSTTFMTHDTSERYLQREWKRYSHHIPKHSSLPSLRLVPSDRPLFVCENCCSSNIYLPLCLWCRWTSDSATYRFENATPRPRTLSAPKFSSDLIQRKRTDRMRRVGIIVGVVAPSRASSASDQSTEPPITPCTTTPPMPIKSDGVESCSYEQIEDMLKEVPTSPIADHHQHKSRHVHDIPSLPPSSAASTVDISPNMYGNKTTGNDYEFEEIEAGSLMYDEDNISEQPLVRNRGRFVRRGSKSDNESISSEPIRPTWPRLSTESHPVHRPMSTPPSSSHRPPRPLYHYIRNKSQPSCQTQTSPFDSGVVHDSRLREGSRVQDKLAPEEEIPTFSYQQSPATHGFDFAIPTRHALSYSSKGFSVSGETEQRMDLARKSDGGGYKFHEVRVRRRDRIGNKVKEITRSFKELFKGRRSTR